MDLFAVANRSTRSQQSSTTAHSRRSSASGATSRSAPHVQQRRDATELLETASEEDKRLFVRCVEQVQRQLKPNINSPSTLHTLASYYTREEPYVEGRPFCVSLSYATFLFHMQMARVSEGDVQLYVQLINGVLAQISDDARMTHPFVLRVLRDAVFGLPSPTCVGGAHCVVLMPPLQYHAFAYLATSLVDLGVVPADIFYQWQDKLEALCNAPSPLVANRALTLIVHTVSTIRMDEQVAALQYVLKTKPRRMNVDFLLSCYERLKRAVPEPVRGPAYGRALSIHCSELFLRFRSPIRREYVERFLYPSLSGPDMQLLVQIPATRQHLCGELLRQCTPGMSPSNPYYLCLCAIMQWAFEDEIDGAMEVVELINCQMPHAAYFAATLAVDTRMSVAMFAKIIIVLVRGAGLAMTGRDVADDVATALQNRTSVYSVLFLLREVVRNCSITASRRATDMHKALHIAVPEKTVEALGKLAMEAFDDLTEAAVDPQLICAELAMVLHQLHIEEAMDAAVAHLRDVTALCIFCGLGRGASPVCEVNGTMHMTGQASVGRVLTTLAECAGMASVEGKLIQLLRDPATQMDSAVHFLLFHILSHAGQHRNTLFQVLEPYIRSTLTTLVSADRASNAGLVGSQQKANVLMLHVKLVVLFANALEPSYVESILRVFCEVRLRSNHDALTLWYMANLLLRQGKGNVELLPTDPAENNYCVNFPGCAPMCNTTADNAQLLLKIIDRSHSFSDETHKLVGCCVCKLIQDFNVQAPNIIESLLTPFGFTPVGIQPLCEYALPVGASSTFWSFFLHQMKLSAPSRIAFMAALAKSISQRFRIAAPADAVAIDGAEATGHLFAVMTYEAMKRNPPLARVVLHTISQWVKQPHHPPGRFACLFYICTQLLTVVVQRGTGPEAVELAAETGQDTSQFTDAVTKTTAIVRGQLPRLAQLGPLVRQENTGFYQLLHRLHHKTKRLVEETTGEKCNVDSSVFNDDIDTTRENVEVLTGGAPVKDTRREEHLLGALQQPSDNSVFGDYMEDDETGSPIQLSVTQQENQAVYDPLLEEEERQQESEESTVPRSQKTLLSSKNEQSTMTSPASGVVSVRERRPREVSFVFVDNVEGANASLEKESCSELPLPIVRSMQSAEGKNTAVEAQAPHSLESRGVQTSYQEWQGGVSGVSENFFGREGECAPTADAEAAQNESSRRRQQGLTFVKGNGSNNDSVADSWREPDLDAEDGGDEEPIDNLALPALQASTPQVDGVAVPSGIVLEYLATHQAAKSVLHELQQFEKTLHITRTQNAEAVAAGANNYDEPHQGRVFATTAPLHTTILPVTMERRPNNYSVPHATHAPAPSKTVMARLTMIQTTEKPKPHEVQSGIQAENQLSASKRRRIEGELREADLTGSEAQKAMLQTPAAKLGSGAQFFLQQSVSSVIKDLGGMQRQLDTLSSVMTPDKCDATALPPNQRTPYGQVVIPECFVEQKNETAVREIRQVMGAHDPNDGRLSTGGRRKIRGSGGPSTGDVENSAAWWDEKSSAPMPKFATDPQYSMELF
ncbi:hypothetical protein TraAM80_09089 [Trypanosoma rangeli]|uniref:Kinetoplastid kinetochore protein 1 n=1 Tax=Trypanosoma rangeli TaxID=5698 RepID=A0A422MX97_TRYRA|nr:uncharacterized protein TraAM80_09089 [Trypanosoma rangeli]RNE97874.1 hypothetical protein TraAM80_09089 [Trypanosoma rangeli]|eukprot:RNE97874.1 hypothetical protein TraAM80_09089 [Trypanosoma rangeli]